MNKILNFIYSFLFLFSFLNNHIYSVESEKKTSSIIYLKGSCSAGKSTFIRSILDCWKEIEVVDEDSIMQKTYVDAVAGRFPCEYACIKRVISQENLYHAIREKDVLFKNNTSDDERRKAADALCVIQEELNKAENASWKQKVSQSIDLQVLQHIKRGIEKGNIVLLDSWYIKPKHLELSFPETKLCKVLLYCSLKNTYDRFLKRNDKALMEENLSEKRYIRQLIGSFISLYEINDKPEGAIELINKFELQDIFSNIASSLKNGPNFYQKPIFTFEEVSKSYFMKLANDFLFSIELSCENETELYIRPKEKYHIILNNEKSNENLIYLLKNMIEEL